MKRSTHTPIVEIDSHSGFCFGVVNAINKAEEELKKNGSVYCLGDIVHNSVEVDRLENEGLITITHDQLKTLHNVKVLLRAHGEPPETYRIAQQNNIEIIDATCPVVLQLQRRIKQSATQTDTQIVIYGKSGHAEVNGLVGQTNGSAIVIESINDLHKIDYSHNIALYAQTTKSVNGFTTLVDTISKKLHPGVKFTYNDTICRQVANRLPNITAFAQRHQAIVFVSDHKSSNGKVLFEACKKVNPQSYFITSPEEIDFSLLAQVQSIGICGATSTPFWLMQNIEDHLKAEILK